MVGVCYLAVIIIVGVAHPASCTKGSCPEVCSCLGSFVDCSSKRLEAVPSHLPKWTTHLDLHDNPIKKLHNVDWKNLNALTGLILNKNKISSIPPEAFGFQKQLKVLELNRNHLSYIDALAFKSLQNLTVLKLKRNQISQLKDGAFYGLVSIDKLILDENDIQVISKGWLYGLKTLKQLSLSHNRIDSIDTDAWEFCRQLSILDLSYNNLQLIRADDFKYLEFLQKLVLSNNSITFIGENAFVHLPNLRILNLNSNKISWAIEDANGVFKGLINLNKFHLANNNIQSINKNGLVGLDNLTYLNLEGNNITSVQPKAFDGVPLSELVMHTSWLLCDCNVRWFYDWLKNNTFEKTKAFCAYPESLRGNALLNVENFTCDTSPKPRLIQEPDPEMMALKGENISLSCTAMSSSSSKMSFQWKKDNVELLDVHTIAKSSTNGRTTETISELNIYYVEHTDAGKYQCVVSNAFGITYSQKSNIAVLIFPVFAKTPKNVTVASGAVAKLECAVSGEPQPEIAWQKDGGNDFPAARERRMHVMPTDDVFFITDIKPSDMGVYSCTAHNAAGTVVANASLLVQEKPSFVKNMENKEVTAGASVVLQCMANGSPKPTIKWLKDGKSMMATERHFFTAEDQLMIIVDTNESDSGVYQCHLNNTLGEEIGASTLKVKQGRFISTDMMGIIIITVVCCAVATSCFWVVIIYQTRKRMSPAKIDNTMIEFTEKTFVHMTADNASDKSSCKDSGTGDSAKRSNDDLARDEFNLVGDDSPKVGWKVVRAPSLIYIGSDANNSHIPLLHANDAYNRSTNHDRADEEVAAAAPAPSKEEAATTTTIDATLTPVSDESSIQVE